MANRINYFTDGAYSSASEMGGWAYVKTKDKEILKVENGCEPYTTNNRMELMAIKRVLELILQESRDDTEYVIYTDSAYIANCFKDKWYLKWINNGWRTSDKRDVANQDLWGPILATYLRLSKTNITIQKTKAHVKKRDKHLEVGSEAYFNDIADTYAVKARKQLEDLPEGDR